MDIKKSYAKKALKHKLPKFEELDALFELRVIEKDDYLLRDIRRRMSDKLEHHIKILEGIINPEATISGLHECKFFNDDEKTELFELYRKLMGVIRQADLLSITNDEAEETKFIKQLYSEWPLIQTKLKGILIKLRKSWVEEEVSKKDIIGYFG